MRAAFDVLVALHVACAVVGFGTVAVSGAYGAITAGSDSPEESRRYFSSPGRAEYLVLAVPVFGAAALWVRPGGHDFAEVWVEAAFGIWAVASVLLLGVVRPSERRVRSGLGRPDGETGTANAARSLAWAGAASDALFVVALFLMVTQPR